MSDVWYKKLGFFNNPFSIKPAAYHHELVAYDMPYIYKKIENSEMLFIEGEYGTGKTTILKNIINKYQGKNRIIYYNFNKGEKVFDVNALIDGATPLLRKVAGLKVKDMIMLLDEVHMMKPGDAKKLIKYYKEGTLKSVVFVSHEYDLVSFPEEYVSLLNGNILRTVSLSASEAVRLVRKRIGDMELLPDRMINKIFTISGKNPRRLLEYCEDVCRYAVEIGDDRVTEDHIEEVLKEVIKQQKKMQEKKEAKEPIPEKRMPSAKPKQKNIVQEEKSQKPMPSLVQPVIEEPPIVEPLEIKELPERREKKFHMNKLVTEDKKNTLGTIVDNNEEKAEEETPEYKIYFLDKE